MKLKYRYLIFFILTIVMSCGGKPQEEVSVAENIEEDDENSEIISKENGGIGFEEIAAAEGWESNPDYVGYANKESLKGGVLLDYINQEPGTYRPEGINSNTNAVFVITSYAYQSLFSLNTLTNEFYPDVATHWKKEIVDGKQIGYFRINPEARWWDGTEITSDDIVTTFEFLKDEGLQDEYTNQFASDYAVEKISKYILKVTIQDLDWKKFWYFGTSNIYPASHLSKIDGATFLEKYNRNQLMGSGPYQLDTSETEEGQRYVLKKTENWWSSELPVYKNMFNFDKIIYEVVADENIIKENFKLGKYYVYSAKTDEWFDEFSPDIDEPLVSITNNVMKRKVVFNYAPKQKSFIAFNQRKPILDDKKFRMAIMHLWNRDLIIEKIYRNDRAKEKSYWPLSKYSSPNLVTYNYDPDKANALLDEMGFTERDEDGTRMNAEGIKLEFSVPSRNYGDWVLMYTLLQSDLKNGGIKINLNSVDFSEWVRIIDDRQFDFTIQLWGGISYPNPISSLHSSIAEAKGSNNTSGIKNPSIDKLIEDYNNETDLQKQPAYIQQIDQLLSEEAYFAYGFVSPYSLRFLYWDIFDYPDTMGSHSSTSMISYWWIDPDKKAQTDKFLGGDITVTMDTESLVNDFWNLKPDDYTPK